MPSMVLTIVVMVLGNFHSVPAPFEWREGKGFRTAPLKVAGGGTTGFSLLANKEVGIDFTNSLSYERAMSNHNLMNGAGVAAGDFDGDGWCDLYFCNLQGSNALFKNLGNWKFENVTKSAGVAATNQASTGAAFADVNGDGRLDLLVSSCGGPNALFINLGGGQFTNRTAAAGLTSRAGSTTMALADVDRDGDLDLYVANYGETSILRTGGAVGMKMVNGQPVVTGRFANRIKIINGIMYELGEPDVLYLNDGNGRFSAVSWTGGTFLDEAGQPLASVPWDMGLSAMFYDFNLDGAPDLYVCNDFQTPDRFWINNGKGIFRAISPEALRKSSSFSMSVDFADLDRDSFPDFFLADMLSRSHLLRMTQMATTNAPVTQVGNFADRPQIRRNMLFHASGDGNFSEIAHFAGLQASEWTWCGSFMDVDLDGFEDLLIANGHAYDTQDLDAMEAVRKLGKQTPAEARNNLKRYPPLRTPNLLFHNQGNLTFAEKGKAWGFESPQVSHGIAQADLDNDGDLDVVLNCLNEPPLVYRNQSSAPRIAVRVRDGSKNFFGVGAKVKLLGGPVPQSQEILAAGRYLSGDEAVRVFAANASNNSHDLEITWPDGRRSEIKNLPGNTLCEISGDNLEKLPAPAKAALAAKYFRDRSELLQHRHQQEPFDEFGRQRGLRRGLSQRGPGVAWIDAPTGRDQLIIGANRGGKLSSLENSADGKFKELSEVQTSAVTNDFTGIAIVPDPAGIATLLIGMSHYQTGATNQQGVFLAGKETKPRSNAAALQGSFGPLAVADIDGMEGLEVFAGGQSVAGRYPLAHPSKLFRYKNAELIPDTTPNPWLNNLGVVNSALFTDINQDGWPDLVVACDWSSLRLFENKKGRLEEVSEAWKLKPFSGWWNSLAVGDFDEDGRLDLVAGNWGLNTTYEATQSEPLYLYFGDVDENGTFDFLEAYGRASKILPRLELNAMRETFPFLAQTNLTHRAYGSLTVQDVLGPRLARAKRIEANTLASSLFLNRGDHFEMRQLPRGAQWAPVFGMNVADFSGDGHDDIFFAQNFSQNPESVSADNSGRGLLLEGDGKGNFVPVPGERSGISMTGDQRGSASVDFNRDGRMDLVIAQNNGETKLYENVTGKPGVRVRLEGAASNPAAIGAIITWEGDNGRKLTRVVQSGSGHWSQNSLIQIFPESKTPTTLRVKWPGGQETRTPTPAGITSAVVNTQGQLRPE